MLVGRSVGRLVGHIAPSDRTAVTASAHDSCVTYGLTIWRMDGRMNECIDGWTDRRMDGWIYGQTDGRADGGPCYGDPYK